MLKNERLSSFIFRISKDFIMIALGVFISGFALKGFLLPNGFIDGGVTGISLLVHFLSPIPLPNLLLLLNLPFIFLATKQVSKTFAIKTFFAVFALSAILLVVNYPVITSDKLLVSVFGGFLLGAGLGLSIRGGCVLDGTEVLAIYLNRKINLSIGEIIFGINILIFSVAAIFLSIETALYSMLIYISATKTVDFIVEGIEEYIGITIISKKSSEIRKRLLKDLGKGVTIYKGKGGNAEGTEGQDIDILFTIVTRLEVSNIKNEILSIDPLALVIENSINEVHGGILRDKRPKFIKQKK